MKALSVVTISQAEIFLNYNPNNMKLNFQWLTQ